MKQKTIKIFVIFLMIFLTNCAQNDDEKLNQVMVDNGNSQIVVNVQIADDNNERAKGLMFVNILNENAGMLFIFEKEDYQIFWMKNTMIPLDIIFIGENMKIIEIKYAEPCLKGPCALYESTAPSKYVLEVNGNFTPFNNITTGNKIKLKLSNQ